LLKRRISELFPTGQSRSHPRGGDDDPLAAQCPSPNQGLKDCGMFRYPRSMVDPCAAAVSQASRPATASDLLVGHASVRALFSAADPWFASPAATD